MKDNKMYEILDIADEKTNELSKAPIYVIVDAYNKIINKINDIREANQLRLAKVAAYILCKTVLKNYLHEMMMYERYAEEDQEERIM